MNLGVKRGFLQVMIGAKLIILKSAMSPQKMVTMTPHELSREYARYLEVSKLLTILNIPATHKNHSDGL